MEEINNALKKAVAALSTASRALGKVRDLTGKGKSGPLEIQEACLQAQKALEKVPAVDGIVEQARQEVLALADQASQGLERERALLAGRIAEALQQAGFSVRGRLPLLEVSAFTLEFQFGKKPRCVLWLGPRQERVAECAHSPEAVVQTVRTAMETLFGSPQDDEAVLRDLHEAYRMACLRAHVPEGERIPLSSLMAEVAFLRQSAAFRANPVRDHFHSFGRLHFAALIGRLRHRRLGDVEMRLGTATMAQTRRLEDHLWIPRGTSGDGTHCATVAFVKTLTEERT